MLGRCRWIVALALLASAAGCGSGDGREPVSVGAEPGVPTEADVVDRPYPGAVCDDLAVELPAPPPTIAVADGRSQPWGSPVRASLEVGLAGTGDLTGDGQPEAVVVATCGTEASLREDRIVVLRDGEVLAVIAQPAERTEAGVAPELDRVEVIDGRITAAWSTWDADDAHCCPSAATAYVLAWDGSAFEVVDGPTTIPRI